MRPNRYRGYRALAVVLTLATTTAACSDLYYDRRETISRHGGDAAASNAAVQTIDPWPAEAANRAIETNGERMQRAIERYRTNKTTSLATAPSAAAPATPALTPTPQLTAPPTQ